MYYLLLAVTAFILAFLFVASLNILTYYKNSSYIVSKIDNRKYLVRNSKNSQQTAETLAQIHVKIDILVDNLHDNQDFANNIAKLKSNYSTMIFSENILMESTSYTIDKTETILCLKTRDSNEDIYDINKLIFVTIHELAHIGCYEYGHGEEFVNFFVFLLENAIRLNVYKYINYNKYPEEYCGIEINSTPIV